MARRVAALGLCLAGFATAAFTARLGDVPLADIALSARTAGIPGSFPRITTGLLFDGLLVIGVAAVADALSNRKQRPRALLGAAAWAVAAWLTLAGLSQSPGGAGWGGILLSGFVSILGLAALLGTIYLVRLDRALAWFDRRLLAPPRRDVTPPGWPVLDAGLVVIGCLTFLIVAFARSLLVTSGAAMVLALAAHLLAWRRTGGTPVPVLPVFAIALIPFASLALAIAGPGDGSFQALASAPFSVPAERLLAGLLLIVAAAFTGLWPFHGVVPRGWAAPVGAVLLLRLGVPLLPGGLIHWQPLVFPILALTIWDAAATRRLPALFSALALMAAASVHDPGTAAAIWLVGGAFLFLVLDAISERSRVAAGVRRLAWLVPAWGTMLAVVAGLQAQVVYTVLAALGLMAGLTWVWRSQTDPQQAPKPDRGSVPPATPLPAGPAAGHPN